MRRFPMTLFSVALVYSLMTLAFASSPALTAFSLHHDSSSLPHVDLSHGAMVDSPPGLDTNNSFTTHAAWIFSRKWATGAPQTPPEPEAFPTSLTYTVVPRRYIPLRLKGSRTSNSSHVYGERVLVPTPTRYHHQRLSPLPRSISWQVPEVYARCASSLVFVSSWNLGVV
ncbi:hypothetical protein CPB84DRAFT_1961087 [Gymnopilus junonius]|uniref:Uncharacterized protein n=1 Tax=Gymnopilus junonius TaxID=109634 RepID=A0A9P5NNZ8_GYMJU|nr:hypothetical protein CPB84DRAFT_1961087 [Gymnopilus junonius]